MRAVRILKILMISIVNNYKYGNTGVDSIVYRLRQNPDNVVDIQYFHNNEQYDRIMEVLLEIGPYDIYGCSVFETNYSLFSKLSNALKKIYKDSCIVLGGQFISMNYETIVREMENIDYLILGDGETPFERLIEHKKKYGDRIIDSDINIVHKSSYLNKDINVEQDVERGVVYDYFDSDTPERNMQKTYCMLTKSNVCTGNCSFCVSRKGQVKYISSDSLAEKIEYIARKYGVRKFFLCDDDIFDIDGSNNRARINRFLDIVDDLHLNIVFSGFAKAKAICNPENADLLHKMSRVGFHHLFIGVDTGNESDRKLYNKRSSLDEGVKAVSLLRKCGIAPRFGMIYFNPFSTIDTIKENYLYLKKIRTANYYHYGGLKLQLLRGTQLFQLTQSSGLLKDSYSFLNTEAYNFEKKDIGDIVDFLDNCFYIKADSIKHQFITLKNKYEILKHMRTDVEDYGNKICYYEGIEAEELEDFFGNLYIGHNIGLCERLLPDFIKRMERRTEVYSILIKELDDMYVNTPLKKNVLYK